MRISLISLCVAMSTMVLVPQAAQAAAPALELPFECGTTWVGNSGASSAHRNNEIDWNLANGQQDLGKPVLAAAAGTVMVEGGATSAYGNYLEIDHGGGYSTLYAHLNTKEVHNGDTVRQGEQIGTVGNTDGNSPGISPHLHFEYRNRGSGQAYPDYIRPASFHGDAFDYAAGSETYTSQNCASNLPADRPGVATVSRTLSQLDVFAKDDDASFLHRNFNGTAWGPWVRLGGQFKSNPAAYAHGTNRIDLLGVGLDGELWQNTWTSGSGWSGWRDTGGGQIQWTPAVTSRVDGTLDVFAVNTDEVVVHRYFNGTTWGAWTSLNATATASPAATALGPDRINVLIRDADGTLATRMWTRANNGWYQWVDRGKKIYGTPGVSHRTDTLMDVFVRDPADKSLLHSASTDGGSTFGGFVELGGQITTPPAAVSMYNLRIDVFSRGTNGSLYQRVWSHYNTPDGWYPWTSLGPIG